MKPNPLSELNSPAVESFAGSRLRLVQKVGGFLFACSLLYIASVGPVYLLASKGYLGAHPTTFLVSAYWPCFQLDSLTGDVLPVEFYVRQCVALGK